MSANRRIRPPAFRDRGRRCGYVYLAVLFTSLIVVAAVAAALSISTANLRRETDRSDRFLALRFAESELQRQAVIASNSAQWRTDATNDVFSAWYPLTANGVDVTGSSKVRRRFTDPDGSLDDDPTDAVQLTIHANVGRSEVAITATLEPDPIPFDILRYAVTATDDIRFEGGGVLSCENPVQVADDCTTATSGVLTTPRLECSGVVQMTLRGDQGPAALSLPSGSVLDRYIAAGQEILFAAIPQQGGDLILQDIVLSPTVNPYGLVDPAGIYWLDAGGLDVRIAHSRLDATLAIRNAGTILISGGITWNFPTTPDAILVSDSRIRLVNVEPKLNETARGINFNPLASPYRQTLANLTTTDTYPTELRGVIYTTGNLRMDPLVGDKNLLVSGAIICRDLRIDGHMTIRPLEDLLDNPLLGLSDPTRMRFVRGSQRRIPSP